MSATSIVVMPKPTITLLVFASLPLPTVVWATLINLRPKAFFDRETGGMTTNKSLRLTLDPTIAGMVLLSNWSRLPAATFA